MTAPKVYEAITSVMEVMAREGIGKDRKNTQQNYAFRGIDDVYNSLCGVLATNKLIMLPFVQNMAREERQTKSGGSLTYTILTVDFKLVSSEDGSTDTVRMIGEAMDAADKSANKAQSAALKYAALQVFMIPTEGDNDADMTTYEVAPRRQPTAAERFLADVKAKADLCRTNEDLDQLYKDEKAFAGQVLDAPDQFLSILKSRREQLSKQSQADRNPFDEAA